jgi:hypothetical protein
VPGEKKRNREWDNQDTLMVIPPKVRKQSNNGSFPLWVQTLRLRVAVADALASHTGTCENPAGNPWSFSFGHFRGRTVRDHSLPVG